MKNSFAMTDAGLLPMGLSSGNQGDVFFKWKKLNLGQVNKITRVGNVAEIENLTCRERYQGLRVGELFAYELAAAIALAWPTVTEIRFESFSGFNPQADDVALAAMRERAFNRLGGGPAVVGPNPQWPNRRIVTHVWAQALWDIPELPMRRARIESELRWWKRLVRTITK
jgi:hypothetical protein